MAKVTDVFVSAASVTLYFTGSSLQKSSFEEVFYLKRSFKGFSIAIF